MYIICFKRNYARSNLFFMITVVNFGSFDKVIVCYSFCNALRRSTININGSAHSIMLVTNTERGISLEQL